MPAHVVIYQAPELHADELAVIAAIDAVNARLRSSLLAPQRWQGVTYREIWVRTLDQGVARRERAPRVPGYNRAMSYILRRRNDPNFRFDLETINALHFMINEEDELAWPGKWRRAAGAVRDGDGAILYRPPEAAAVPLLMAELVDMLNQEDDTPPIVRAALAKLNLVHIHPFRDGNGRLARCLYSLVMMRSGYSAPALVSIEEYTGHHREEYDRVLQSLRQVWNPSADTRAWLRFCLVAQYRQAIELLLQFRRFERLSFELNGDMTETGFESGASIASSELFGAPPPQLASWRELISKDIDRAAGLNTAFRFQELPTAERVSEPNPQSAPLLEESLLDTNARELDPFQILEHRRTAVSDRATS